MRFEVDDALKRLFQVPDLPQRAVPGAATARPDLEGIDRSFLEDLLGAGWAPSDARRMLLGLKRNHERHHEGLDPRAVTRCRWCTQ